MRLFTAIPFRDLAGALGPLIDDLREQMKRLAPRSRVTWVRPEDAHLTLNFIGEVNDERARAVMSACEAPVPLPPFEVSLQRVGAFPPGGAPRVIWLGVDDPSRMLHVLADELQRRLSAAGVDTGDRPLRPHVTVARVRDAAGLKTRALLDGWADASAGQLLVTSATLFESRLSSSGAEHVPLVRVPLEGR
jgi:2'-5' RNA ligase